MKVKKIFIPRKNINKQNKDESFLFYMSSWFLSEMKTLKSLYFFSMNVRNASPLEVYGRNYRTMFMSCLLGAKLWEGWQMLKGAYFSTKIHSEYEALYSKEAKNSLVFLKTYFGKGKETIIGKIRYSTFHYPSSQEGKEDFEKYFNIENEGEGTEYFIGDSYEQSLFSIDLFIANVLDKTKAKDVNDAIKKFHKEIREVMINFYRFLGEYILLFQKKCGFSQEDKQLENVATRKDINIPFFFKEKN